MLISFDYLFKKYYLSPKGVLHVGSSTGQEAEAYNRCGIKKAVFVEAIPEVYEKLVATLLSYPDYYPVNACITDADDQIVNFNVSSNEGQSSSIYEFGTHADCHPDVKFVDKLSLKTHRIDTLIEKHVIDFEGIDFINFDIQGAELLALKSMGKYLENITAAYLEVNKQETYRGCALVEEVDAYLLQYGLHRVETTAWIGNTWGDAMYVKKNLIK